MPNPPPHSRKTRVLFIAEAVTLAHVARPVTLAQALEPEYFEVHLAHCARYRALLGELSLIEHELHSTTPQQFMRALANGAPVYDFATLNAYVEADLQLIAAVQPDVIVGDFRLSLAVSAELAAVPYVALSNAYWSPFCQQYYTVPELPLTRTLGPRLGQLLFSAARPFAFALHCLPMHRLRRHYGLASLGFNLGRVYTHGDYTLYADVPELYRMQQLPHNHRFIGPINWSPRDPHPDWWGNLPRGRPIVYLTTGSSGQAGLLPELIAALGRVDVTALVSTAGGPLPQHVPENVYVASYLPGEDAVKMASLVVCNGGSPSTHQALAQGVPVIGVASNLDQFLNMAAIERTGAGRVLRAGSCNTGELVTLINSTLSDSGSRTAAQNLAVAFGRYNARENFTRILNEISGPLPRRGEIGSSAGSA